MRQDAEQVVYLIAQDAQRAVQEKANQMARDADAWRRSILDHDARRSAQAQRELASRDEALARRALIEQHSSELAQRDGALTNNQAALQKWQQMHTSVAAQLSDRDQIIKQKDMDLRDLRRENVSLKVGVHGLIAAKIR